MEHSNTLDTTSLKKALQHPSVVAGWFLRNISAAVAKIPTEYKPDFEHAIINGIPDGG